MKPELEQARDGWIRAINVNPEMIVLYRRTLADNGFGKMVSNPLIPATPLIAQRGRVSHEAQANDGPGPGGLAENMNRQLMMERTADVQRGDVFDSGGKRYEVRTVDIIRLFDGIVGIRAELVNVVNEVATT